MRRVALLIFLAGCGSSDVAAPVLPPVDPVIPAPAAPKIQGIFAEMDLPVEGADVSGSAEALTVVYREGAAEAVLAAWSTALEGHGWVLDSDVTADGQTTRTWSREGRILVLGVIGADGRVTVSAQDLGAF